MLEGINYGTPSGNRLPSWRPETCCANVLELDDHGEPVNEKHAERRAAEG
jgi:hypothetical protein